MCYLICSCNHHLLRSIDCRNIRQYVPRFTRAIPGMARFLLQLSSRGGVIRHCTIAGEEYLPIILCSLVG